MSNHAWHIMLKLCCFSKYFCINKKNSCFWFDPQSAWLIQLSLCYKMKYINVCRARTLVYIEASEIVPIPTSEDPSDLTTGLWASTHRQHCSQAWCPSFRFSIKINYDCKCACAICNQWGFDWNILNKQFHMKYSSIKSQ